MDQDTKEFFLLIDTLTTEERRELRDFYRTENPKVELPRSLSYNYNTQEWI